MKVLRVRMWNQGVLLSMQKENRTLSLLHSVDVSKLFVDYCRKERGPREQRFGNVFYRGEWGHKKKGKWRPLRREVRSRPRPHRPSKQNNILLPYANTSGQIIVNDDAILLDLILTRLRCFI